MDKTVTIGLPIYKRLQYLPNVLKVIAAQDYPAVELLVSDNGVNGTQVRDLVAKTYPRAYRFRQNPKTVNVVAHINQLIQEASGDYLVFIGDDDEISANFVSELVTAIERHPRAVIAFSRQEFFSETGEILSQSVDVLPDILSGPEFIPIVWQSYKFGFRSISTYLGKKEALLACGGLPEFRHGNHSDDAVVVKMCLRGDVAFSSKCLFRKMSHDSSLGNAVDIRELEAATRQFIEYLDGDSQIQEYSAAHPDRWNRLRNCLVEMAWQTYLNRWRSMYRHRLPYWRWARAGFAVPIQRAYWTTVVRSLLDELPRPFSRPGCVRN